MRKGRWDRSSLSHSNHEVTKAETASISDVGVGLSVVIKKFGLSSVSSSGSNATGKGESGPLIQVNQVVACVPTAKSREDDKRAGYNLPFSLGRVLEVKGSGVVVAWLFAFFADVVWRPWDTGKKGASRIRRDELDWEDLLRDRNGVVVVGFCADKTLKQSSLARLRGNRALEMSEADWRSYFKKPKK